MENNIYLEKIAAEQKGYGAAEVGGLVAGGVAGKALMDKSRAKALAPLAENAAKASRVDLKNTETAIKHGLSSPLKGFNMDNDRGRQLMARSEKIRSIGNKAFSKLENAKKATKGMGVIGAVGGALVGFDVVNSLRNKMSKKD